MIPKSITSLGEKAFEGCEDLEEVEIDGVIPTVGNDVFEDCEELIDDDGFIVIKGILYGYCGKSRMITVPLGVKLIGDNSFKDHSSIESVIIPDGVEIIEDYAFAGCIALTSVTVPASVTSIGDYAFQGCSSLKKISVPAAASEGHMTFDGCKDLVIDRF